MNLSPEFLSVWAPTVLFYCIKNIMKLSHWVLVRQGSVNKTKPKKRKEKIWEAQVTSFFTRIHTWCSDRELYEVPPAS